MPRSSMLRRTGVRAYGRAAVPLLPLLLSAAPARAQALDSLVTRLGAMSAVTGFEDAMADTLVSLLPGARRDRAGNIVLVRGQGVPYRLITCPLDERGYVVGSITPDGYLSLRRVGEGTVSPLYDQWLEGQRVTVFGRRGAVPGVVGVRSTHLTRGRATGADEPFSIDNAWVDVGARTAAEAAALGVGVLAPVTRAKQVQRYGQHDGLLAAPAIAQRAACAALISAAAHAASGNGTTVIAFVRRQHFADAGTAFVLRGYAGAETVLLGGTSGDVIGSETAVAADSVNTGTEWARVARWSIPARYADTPAETVAMIDVEALERRIAEWLAR
jgi:putative aminopeptidase FrvX